VTPGARPWEIVTGPDGDLWFTEIAGNRIGRMTPSGVLTEFPVPTGSPGIATSSLPNVIARGPGGFLVFSEQRGNKIGAITTDGRIVEFEVPTPASAPVGVTAGPAQDVWFAESSAANRIGRILGFRGLVTAALAAQ